jgi:PDZ domain
MRRRHFITIIAAVTAVWPLAVYAQQDDRMRALEIRILSLQAEGAAEKIGQFIQEIENQVGWTTQLTWSASTIEQRRFDGLRLLRLVPAITELAQLDASGMERLRVSRRAMDLGAHQTDYSNDPKFTEAVAKKVYYGPVYFRREEPVNFRREESEHVRFSRPKEFSGLGIYFAMENGLIKVVTPIDEMPAAKAGIMAEDIITKLDDEQVQGLTLEQAAEKMRGPVGTEIKLTIIRKGQDEPIEVSITRDVIRMSSRVSPATSVRESQDTPVRESQDTPARVPEPYLTLSLAGTRRDAGVSVAEANLKLIWDLVTRMKVGEHGVAYVLDAQGRVIVHPDISLVQRDFSSLPQVQAARAPGSGPVKGAVQVARDINGREVLATYAPVARPNLGWLVLVELPVEEANATAQ